MVKNVIIDDYNLINADPGLSRLLPNDQDLARAGLRHRIAAYASRKRIKIRIYYDGPNPASRAHGAGIKEIFAKDADSAILGFLRKSDQLKNYLVVSSDNDVVRPASDLGAKVTSSEAFLQELRSRGDAEESSEKPERESPEEIKRLLREFEGR